MKNASSLPLSLSLTLHHFIPDTNFACGQIVRVTMHRFILVEQQERRSTSGSVVRQCQCQQIDPASVHIAHCTPLVVAVVAGLGDPDKDLVDTVAAVVAEVVIVR